MDIWLGAGDRQKGQIYRIGTEMELLVVIEVAD